MKALEDDGCCFVCGRDNPAGLGVEFKKTERGAVADFAAPGTLQGYRGIVHGGIIALLLDEASVKAVVLRGIKAVTAELNLRFRNPLQVGERVRVHADITDVRRTVYHVEGEIRREDGELIAASRAKLLSHE